MHGFLGFSNVGKRWHVEKVKKVLDLDGSAEEKAFCKWSSRWNCFPSIFPINGEMFVLCVGGLGE